MQSAKRCLRVALVGTLLLVLVRATSVSLAGSLGAVAPTPVTTTWRTYTSDTTGIALQHPASWYLYTDRMQGRYRGLNPILLTSFEVEFEEFGHGLEIPPGGAAIIVGFEG